MCARCDEIHEQIDADLAGRCWRTTGEGRAAQAALQEWISGLTPEELERIGLTPGAAAKQAAAIARIRERAAARRGR